MSEGQRIKVEPCFHPSLEKEQDDGRLFIPPRKLMIIRPRSGLPEGMEILAKGQYEISTFGY